jgi:hypothetical protein
MVEELNSLDREGDILPTYAARVARMLYLRQYCSEQHLVFQTELLLIRTAESKLKKWLIDLHGPFGLKQLRASIEAELRSLIKEKLKNLDSGPLFPVLTDEVSGISFDFLFLDQN